MKFTVEVDDFYIEDGHLGSQLEEAVTRGVIFEIRKDIQDKVDELMDRLVKKEIMHQIETRITVLMENFLKEGKVKAQYSNQPEMTVEEWIATNFKGADKTIKDFIEKSSKMQVEELKKRYDLLFASQIVTKLNEQKMLKEDIANILLKDAN